MGRALVSCVFWRAIVLALILAVSPSAAVASVGTGETNGIYYPLGDVICGIVNQNLHESGVRCSRESTPGSVYNADALRDHELEFAIVQSDVAYDAYHGTGAYSGAPFPALRSVLALHPELVTIVARAGIHELGDLAGKRMVAGPSGSGSRATWEAMVKALGWKGGQTPQTVDMRLMRLGTPSVGAPSTPACWCSGIHPRRFATSLLAARSIFSQLTGLPSTRSSPRPLI
jgi:TRAP transporter TAXI family solute receptor